MTAPQTIRDTNMGDVFGELRQRPIATPYLLAGCELSNRAVVAPMTRVSAGDEGIATPRMRDYYGAYARGGFAVVITEGTYTDTDASQGYDGQPGIATDEQAHAWRPIADAIHDGGAVAIMQLMHAGALSQRTRGDGRTLAPSRVKPRGQMMPEYGGAGSFPIPTEATLGDIESVKAGFVEAAKRARAAGFDGVEIHAANGYLLDQFNTVYTNLRNDRYGGPVNNRIRLTAEIIEAVRRATDDRFIVGVRLSEAKVNDFDYRWPGGAEEAAAIFQSVAFAGASYIHLAGEGRGFRDAVADGKEPYTSLARRLTGLPVIANGGLGDPDLADEVIAGGHADLIAVGRAALANPDWPTRVANSAAIEAFSPDMLSPSATIENGDRWFARQ